VEHDLTLLDYISDACCLCYGVRGAYGVASASLGSKEGINAFLSGYLPTENLRFRSEALNFKKAQLQEEEDGGDGDGGSGGGGGEWRYPALSKTLGNFSLRVEAGAISPGEIVLLLGQNGVGKTCFVKMLAGLLPADGSTALPELHVSYKPQHIAPSFDGNVRQLLERHIADALAHDGFAADVIQPLRLETLLERRVDTLSGGELQRLAIALCLGRPADVYLLDEPSAYLDSEQRISVARMLKRFMRFTRKSCLVVEHDLMLATYLADHVIVYEGTPAVEAVARAPEPLHRGMNRFLEKLQVTFRRDPETHRPRINKLDSVVDKEQKASGHYFYLPDA
jgi:ATP-binding cassette subfamily E protein 1